MKMRDFFSIILSIIKNRMFFQIHRHFLFKPMPTKKVMSTVRCLLILLICCGSLAFSQDESPQSDADFIKSVMVKNPVPIPVPPQKAVVDKPFVSDDEIF